MNEPSLLLQLGVGGIFTVLVLREVFGFMERGGAKSKSGNGDKNTLSREEFDRRMSGVQFSDNCEQIVKRFDVMFASLMTQRNEDRELQEKQFARLELMFDEIQKKLPTGEK